MLQFIDSSEATAVMEVVNSGQEVDIIYGIDFLTNHLEAIAINIRSERVHRIKSSRWELMPINFGMGFLPDKSILYSALNIIVRIADRYIIISFFRTLIVRLFRG